MPLANITQLEPFNLDSTASYTFANVTATSNVVAGNVNVSGIVSATGNVTGGNVLTGGLISATGNISSAGNISGTYFIGNGSLLTGISTSTSKIFNGTSEANIGTANGNANISIAGTSNVAVFTPTGLEVTGTTSASGNVTGGNILTAGIMSAVGNAIANTFLGDLQGSNVTVTISLTVSGTTELGNISNVKIDGGTSGQVITTDGSGNLSFSAMASSPAPMPLVINTGDTLTIPANYQGLFAIPLEVDGTLEILGVLVEV